MMDVPERSGRGGAGAARRAPRRGGAPPRGGRHRPQPPGAGRAGRRAPTCRALPCRRRPSSGARVADDCRPTTIWDGIDLKTLYRLSWGGKNPDGAEYERLVQEDFEPRRLRMQDEGLRDGWLALKAVYGYWRCAADGEELVDLRRTARGGSAASRSRARRCTTACRSPTTSAPSTTTERDVVAFQVVTAGHESQAHIDGCRRPASTPRRTSRTAWRSPRRRAWPRRCTGA